MATAGNVLQSYAGTLYDPSAAKKAFGINEYAQNYMDPKMVRGLARTLGDVQRDATEQYLPFIQNPTSHPLYQAQIGGLLQSLIPSENRARTSLTDMFRASGGLRSGAYGREAWMLEGELMGRRQQAASSLLGQMFPQMVQALQAPMNQTSALINALKLNYGTGQSGSSGGGVASGWDNIPPSLGLHTPMTSDLTGTGMGATGGNNPYSAFGPGFSQVAGSPATASGGSQYTLEQLLRAFQPNPLSPQGAGSTTTGIGMTGFSPQRDEFGYTAQDWANDPFYN